MFRFAIVSGWATVDPTTSLNNALKPKPRVKHMARVPLAELPGLVAAIQTYDGESDSRRRATTRDALLLTLLTWARTSEARFVTWDEFEDLDGAEPLWRLSAERMKMAREHLVPLSSQAADLLLRRRRTSNDDYVFPGEKPRQPISANTMIYACYRMGYRGRQTVHGFRGLASTWANESERYRPDWVEMALAHEDENEVRGAYNSALYLTPRRRMLQHWADDILKRASGTGKSGDVPAPVGATNGTAPGCETTSGCRNAPRARARLPFWRRSEERKPPSRSRPLA
ncbi:integrase [Sphingopyxis sp. JAI128]|nr:site-specific integrase [Sphingopyxis sp. JAI128]MBB6427473.1 integrase [Sphingopyxis sp. JAI128]